MSGDVYKPKAFRKAEPEGPVDRTRFATIALQIGAVLYIMVGLVVAVVSFALEPFVDLPADLPAGSSTLTEHRYRVGTIWILVALLIGIGVLSLAVARGLRHRKRWAWLTARVLFITLYLTTILLPAGAVGLYGLMSEGTRAKFPGVRRRDRVQRKH